ncbi:ABC transporter-like, ATP-binding domain [Dillenia turbinata]|uniref:ABC transporter-like, ATP-binding domain n=1 Tax=Dillenia turbinata TaxID=194707 RepID=A0AAN8ZP67_9MAGN
MVLFSVSIEQPKVEVRFENINVDAEAYVGGRAIPTVLNSCVNAFQDVLHRIRILPNKKEKISILQNVSGILKPGRMTLLLGPPGSGKTTLLSILAGKSTPGLKALVSEKSHNRIVTDYTLRVSSNPPFFAVLSSFDFSLRIDDYMCYQDLQALSCPCIGWPIILCALPWFYFIKKCHGKMVEVGFLDVSAYV